MFWKGKPQEVPFEKFLLSDTEYAELIAGIRTRMEEISYAQGCERKGNEDRSVSVV